MTHLGKLKFKTVARNTTRDPVMARRDKLLAGLQEQKLVHAAAINREDHHVERSKWMTNEQGERVAVKAQRRVRACFFEQDGGWYVQCRYGARVLAVDGVNNAVFVKSLEEVGTVLDAFAAAANAGELDGAIERAAERKTADKAPEAARG